MQKDIRIKELEIQKLKVEAEAKKWEYLLSGNRFQPPPISIEEKFVNFAVLFE